MTVEFQNDPLWAQPVLSYTVASFAPPSLQQAAQPVQKALATIAGGADRLHLAPSPSLHISLYGIAPVRSDFDKEAYWRQEGAAALAELARFCASQPPITLRLHQLRATATAVIAVAESNEAIWDLRRRMAKILPPPPGGAVQYDLIHMTIARYAQAAALPADFAGRIAALPIDLLFPIETILVMRETIYPSLAYDTVAAHALSAAELVP